MFFYSRRLKRPRLSTRVAIRLPCYC